MALKIDTKFEGKLTCASKNDMMKLANWHQSTFESLKFGTFIGSFYPKQKMYEFKISEELCVMTMKNDSKFEEDLTGQFKIDFQILTRAIKNVKNLLFNGLLLRKYIMFELSNYRGVMFADTQD